MASKGFEAHLPDYSQSDSRTFREAAEAFNKISEACSGILGFEEVLGNVLDAAIELLGLDGGVICIVTPEDMLGLVAQRGLSQASVTDLSTEKIRVGDCLCGKVAHEQKPLILWTEEEVGGFVTNESQRGEHFQFHAAFPLSTRGVCHGVLCVFSRGNEKPLRRQLRVLGMVTTMAAMVIENARLYEDKTKKELEIRQAYIDILAAVTGGKLVIMTPGELDTALGKRAAAPTSITEPRELGRGRAYLRQEMLPLLSPSKRANDALVAVSEAMTNAVMHGGGGKLSLFHRNDIVQAVVIDAGPGIDFQLLPKATLMSGFSTKRSLGMGFDLMLELCDRLLLASDRNGTTIVLEFARQLA